MNTEAEIEIVDTFYRLAKYYTTSGRVSPEIALAASDWEVKFQVELNRLKAELAKSNKNEKSDSIITPNPPARLL